MEAREIIRRLPESREMPCGSDQRKIQFSGEALENRRTELAQERRTAGGAMERSQ